MCLVIKEYTRRRVAGKDIEVFKVLDRYGASPYQNSKYRKGWTKRALMDNPMPRRYRLRKVNRGLHAYRTIERAQSFVREWAWRHRDSVFTHRMVIPKGAEYYLGHNGDIVSTRLKWPT